MTAIVRTGEIDHNDQRAGQEGRLGQGYMDGLSSILAREAPLPQHTEL